MSDFQWNSRKVKTVKLISGQQVVTEVSPKEIIMNPNTHRVETILQAACLALSEIMDEREIQAERLKGYMSRVGTVVAESVRDDLA